MEEIMKKILVTLSVLAMLTGCKKDKINEQEKGNNMKPEILMTVESNSGEELGKMKIELYKDVAPNHVERILTLSEQGFYNGLTFHRVIENFMVQAGCPLGNGTGGSELPNLVAEFNEMKHTRGVLSMARAMDPNSANSQFFIMLDDAPHLDGEYTAFGKVIEGEETLDKIMRGNPYDNGMVTEPSKIKSIEIVK
jgi:peptidylprolyl isomerase